ncbi:MAG TPA: phosphodiesterase [Hydrogenophaga sp.]|nr:phosphodiesterase [Hydrogenophaga sp.]
MPTTTAPEFFIQLSDPHIMAKGLRLVDSVDTAAFLERAIAQILAMTHAPSQVLITGDLVERGGLDEYAHLRELLAPLPCPVLLMPGNHDAVPKLREVFADHRYLSCTAHDPALADFALYEASLGSRRLLALDTVVPGKPFGSLCVARLGWLRSQLEAAPDTPTVVAMHHPPFATGIHHMDDMGLREGADELDALVAQHPQVERILCGHLHRPITRRFGGTVAMTAPSTAHQITLGLMPDSPPSFIFEPPGFYIHTVQTGHLVTHLQPVGDFGEPQLFR